MTSTETHEPTPFQKAMLEIYPPPRLFAVISWGAAATAWLARSLNNVEGIFCVHAANIFWRNLGGAPHLDGVPYLRLIGAQGSAHALAGDVHGVSRYRIPELQNAFGDKIRFAVVIREPMARLRSQFALFDQLERFDGWNVEHVPAQLEKAGYVPPDTDRATLLRLHGVGMLNAIVDELACGPVFRSEDLTADPAVFAGLVEHLSAGTIRPEPEAAARIVGGQAVNAHAAHKEAIAPMPDWIVEAIAKLVTPEAKALYRNFGYPSLPG